MFRLGWFSTGRGEGSRGLLRLTQDRIASGYLPVEVQFVFCNRAPGEAEGSDQFHSVAHSLGFPLLTLSSRRFRKQRAAVSFNDVREDYDSEVLRLVEPFKPDICVLAGYMLYTGPKLFKRFTMINLHPALPDGPIGTWQEIVWQLIDQRATQSGAMVHLATEAWDRGPVISYCSFSLSGPDFVPLWEHIKGKSADELKAANGEALPLFQRIRQEGVKREAPLLLETIKAFAEGSARVTGPVVVDTKGQPLAPRCLNDRIKEWMAY